MKEQYIITLHRPHGVSVGEMRSYIRDAVESWTNGVDPKSPLFNLKDNVRSIKRTVSKTKGSAA